MCLPRCRDPRGQRPGIAHEVWDELRRQHIDTDAMRVWLHDWGVDRFGELCWSHASGVLDGLTKGILADDLRALMSAGTR